MIPSSSSQNKYMASRKKFSTFDSLASDDYDEESNPFVKELLVNNRRWVKETHDKDPEFFAKLAQPQKPKYLYFGCADSRVPANEILGLGYVSPHLSSCCYIIHFFVRMISQ